MKYFNYKQKNNGFTLIETLTGVMIFSSVIVLMVSLSGTNLKTILQVKQRIQAEYLADEGVEYIRHIRDNAILSNNGDTNAAWNEFNTWMNITCNHLCDVNILTGGVVALGRGSPKMTYNDTTGYIGRSATTTQFAPYDRKITINELTPSVTLANGSTIHAISVIVQVFWKEGTTDASVETSEIFYFYTF